MTWQLSVLVDMSAQVIYGDVILVSNPFGFRFSNFCVCTFCFAALSLLFSEAAIVNIVHHVTSSRN